MANFSLALSYTLCQIMGYYFYDRYFVESYTPQELGYL